MNKPASHLANKKTDKTDDSIYTEIYKSSQFSYKFLMFFFNNVLVGILIIKASHD